MQDACRMAAIVTRQLLRQGRRLALHLAAGAEAPPGTPRGIGGRADPGARFVAGTPRWWRAHSLDLYTPILETHRTNFFGGMLNEQL